MARYIDADKLFRYVDEQTHLSKGKLQNYIRENVIADVVEVKHGHWIEMSKDSVGKAFMCSVCGAAEVTDSFDKSPLDNSCNYCYRCGAKMEGGRDT